MPEKFLCRLCSKQVSATKSQRYRSHSDGDGEPCKNSSDVIPEDLLPASPTAAPEVPVEGEDFATCPDCRRKVKLTVNGYYEDHDVTLRGGTRCLRAGTRKRPLKATVESSAGDKKPTEVITLPGDSLPERGLAATRPEQGKSDSGYALDRAREKLKAARADSPESTGSSATTPTAPPAENVTAIRNLERQPMAPSPESTSTPPQSSSSWTPSDLPEPGNWPTGVQQPGSAVQQPVEIPPEAPRILMQPPSYDGPVKGEPMGDLAKELATRIKETFYSYSNRKTTDNRGAQTTLGPSEIGTPCDRRLAMALMDIAPVNPGGDGWASFVGTCGHTGMAEIYTFADAGTGRYAVEMPVFLGIPTVPRGTTDLLDRRDGTIVDWKFMGAYSLKKFKEQGASETYKVQAHTYGYGAELAGEKVRNVAVVGLPRAGSDLDEMHIWTEKYDKKIAIKALKRVEDIYAKIQEIRRPDGLGDTPGAMSTAGSFKPADDCRYCPFFLKNDAEMLKGCPGV